MFILCLVDASTIRTVAVGLRIPRRPVCSLHFRRRSSVSSRSFAHNLRFCSVSPLSVLFSHFSMDIFFVNALVRASLCKTHSSSYQSALFGKGIGVGAGGGGSGGEGGRGRGFFGNCSPSRLLASTSKRGYSQKVVGNEPRSPYSQELNSELVSFTDPYFDPDAPVSPPDQEGEKINKDNIVRRLRALPWLSPSTHEGNEALEDFLKCLGNPETSSEYLFQCYQKLPAPQLRHLSWPDIKIFVSRMMTVPLRDEFSMLRYLSILNDLKTANIPISRNEWNAAMSFVARAFKKVTLREAEATIQLWKESELTTGVASDATTLNILLDLASRSDTPVLADWILREMETRGIGLDRFTHTTIITYHGFRGDGEGVRSAYRGLVDAGEIVDTVVLNAVMSALFRAKQPQSAEYIYENMKRVTLDPPQPPPIAGPTDWQGKRAWAQKLKRIAKQRRIIEGYMKEFNASLAPDVYTFNMLILQYCRVGDYDKAQELLGDMKKCSVDIDETILVAILKGFYWYGGLQYSPWTSERLDIVIRTVFGRDMGISMERSLAIWVIRAVAMVYNSKKRVLEVWDIIERKWESQGSTVDDEAIKALHELVGRDSGPRERETEQEEKDHVEKI